MKSILAIFILASTTAYSQQQAPCPNVEKLDMFCSSVGGLNLTMKVGRISTITSVSCTRRHASTCMIRSRRESRKISDMWSRFENHPHLDLQQPAIDIVNGSVIKYAVSRGIDPFIRDAIRYKLNLNKVDAAPPGDGRTLLDYVQVELEREQGHCD